MSKTAHFIYVYSLSLIVIATTLFLAYKGYDYYGTPMEERFYHPDHENFKPAGIYGHGLGIVGTLLILIGVVMYIVRKRSRRLARLGRLKYWLEFHIFLCSLGPVMVLFHTAFKFGGIVSVAFWSMVAVVASGVIGRFIYIQIPRTLEGRALSLHELHEMTVNTRDVLRESYQLEASSLATLLAPASTVTAERNVLSGMIAKYFEDRKAVREVKRELRKNELAGSDIRKVARVFKMNLR